MMTGKNLAALRDLMKKHNLQAYYIPSSDPHQDEYVPEFWQRRKFISGFTGSAGDVAITPAVALTVGVNQTKALLHDGTALALAGGLTLRARHSGTSRSRANANAAGKNAGFGVAAGLTVAVDRALAEMG